MRVMKQKLLTKRRGEFLDGDHTRLTNMSDTQEQIASLAAQVEALTAQVAAIAGVLVRKEQKEQKVAFAAENVNAAGLLGDILAKVASDGLDFSDPAAVSIAFETSYADAKTRQEIDPLRQKLREIYMSSSKAWREASRAAARPIEGILVNPDCHIHRKVKSTVALLAADRANAIHGVGGGWTKGHVDPRLSNIVNVVLPALIAEGPEKHQEQLYSWLTSAQAIIDSTE